MIVYGVALLSACLIAGMLIGETLGVMLGVSANVGGVGIAMLFLVFASNSEVFKSMTQGISADCIKFWSAMYIPIVAECCCSNRRWIAGPDSRSGCCNC